MRVFVRSMLATQIMHFKDMVAAGESPSVQAALITHVTKLGPAVAGMNVSDTLCRWGDCIRASFAASNSHIVGGACASAGLERITAALKHAQDASVGQFAMLQQQLHDVSSRIMALSSQVAALQNAARSSASSPFHACGASAAAAAGTSASAAGGSEPVAGGSAPTAGGGASAAGGSASAAGGSASAAGESAFTVGSDAAVTGGSAASSAMGPLSSTAALAPSRTLRETDPISIFIEWVRNESVGNQFTKQDNGRIKLLARAMLAAGSAEHGALVKRVRAQASSSLSSPALPSDVELRIAARAMLGVLAKRIDAAYISEGLTPASWTFQDGKILACSFFETQLKKLKEHGRAKGTDYAQVFSRALTRGELDALIKFNIPAKSAVGGKRKQFEVEGAQVGGGAAGASPLPTAVARSVRPITSNIDAHFPVDGRAGGGGGGGGGDDNAPMPVAPSPVRAVRAKTSADSANSSATASGTR
jgi:hypothetical protein